MRTEREAMGLPPLPTPLSTLDSTPTAAAAAGAGGAVNDDVQGGVSESAGLEGAAVIRTEVEEAEELLWLVWPFQVQYVYARAR